MLKIHNSLKIIAEKFGKIRIYAYLCAVDLKTKRSMKSLILEQKLRTLGCDFYRHGSNHDIWTYENGRKFPFPRHSDIDEKLACSMIKRAKQNRRS